VVRKNSTVLSSDRGVGAYLLSFTTPASAERRQRAFSIRLFLCHPDSPCQASSPSPIKSKTKSKNEVYERTASWKTQFLIAVLAGLQVPFVCSETHELGEELVGSYLYQIHLYHWLESNDYGRSLSDNDL
jgi:hypothetical protein